MNDIISNIRWLSFECVEKALMEGLDVNQVDVGLMRGTMLHHLAWGEPTLDWMEMVKLLLRHQADARRRDVHGRTVDDCIRIMLDLDRQLSGVPLCHRCDKCDGFMQMLKLIEERK